MNDHLDECPEVFIDCYGTLCDCEYSHFCICDALRACEDRVTAAAVQRVEALATERELQSPSEISVDLRDVIAAIKGDSDA